MAEKLDLREWVEQEIPKMAAVAESRRGDPVNYKAAVESICTLQHIRHTAIYDKQEADGMITIPEPDLNDFVAALPKSKGAEAPVDDVPEPEPPLDKSDVRAKLVELKNAGLNLKELWDKFGVIGLSGVDPKDYRKLLKTAEELSA